MSENLPVKQKVSGIRDLLEKSKPQIAMALPKHITPERMLRVAMTAIQRTPKLLDCTPLSLVGCIIQASELGLEPNGVLGQAYLVPYKNTVQLIPGYMGLIDLCRRSGQLSTICAYPVYKDEPFEIRLGLDPDIKHTPTRGPHKDADLIGVYAVAKLKDGGVQFEWMWKEEIDSIRKRSKASNDGPWVTDYVAMAKKTVLKRLLKMLPKSVEMSQALDHEEAAEQGLPQDLGDVVEIPAEDFTEATSGNGKDPLDQVVDERKGKEETAKTEPSAAGRIVPEEATKTSKKAEVPITSRQINFGD